MGDLVAIIMPLLKDIQPGRLIESLIFLAVLFWRINPLLNKMIARIEGCEKAIGKIDEHVAEGFALGEKRFQKIEDKQDRYGARLEVLENKVQP